MQTQMSNPEEQQTIHSVEFCNANAMQNVGTESVQLVVTSPPYPMIQMWDGMFSNQDGEIAENLAEGRGLTAFELMHRILDDVWREVDRVLVPGGICCINIGDATRTLDKNFCLYPNNQRISECFLRLGQVALPPILWRKVTNAPNKFMGSGMMPPGAYVTLEHEWILIFRKGRKREFKTETEKCNRRESAFFWEERNKWYSDLWNLQGTAQRLTSNGSRDRSAAFPLEIPYRLINMFSVKGDIVLDPFYGTGTTTIAAIASERSSIGVEIDEALKEAIRERISRTTVSDYEFITRHRLSSHEEFVNTYHKPMKYYNAFHGFDVVTKVEEDIKIHFVDGIEETTGGWVAYYCDGPHKPLSIFDSSNLMDRDPSLVSL